MSSADGSELPEAVTGRVEGCPGGHPRSDHRNVAGMPHSPST